MPATPRAELAEQRLHRVRARISAYARMHARQQRGGGTPFILDPLEVGSLL